jgi:signal transduction histidine kinase
MFEWIQNHKWLAAGSFTLSNLVIFGGIDLFLQGPSALPAAALFALTTAAAIIWAPAAIALAIAGAVLEFSFGLLPVSSGLAIGVAVMLSQREKSAWIRYSLVAASVLSGLAITANTAFNFDLFRPVYGMALTNQEGRLAAFVAGSILVASVNALFALVGSLVYTRETYVGTNFDRALSERRQAQLALENAQQRERFQIARDINELIIQKITAVLSLSEGGLYAAKADPSAALRSLERVTESASAAHVELRRLYDMLNREQTMKAAPPRINDLEALAISYRELGYNASVRHEGNRFSLNEGAELVIFKIAFDALENVKQHCPVGTDVTIDFSWVDGGMQLLVKDNGIEVANRAQAIIEGYAADEDYRALVEPISGVNVNAMRERAALYEGSVEVTRVPGVGFTVSAIFPRIYELAPGKREA